jgi:hypothetical protein
MKLRAKKELTPTMSRVYPERKWAKERRHQIEKRNLNRVKQISILALSITKRKPDIRGSGGKENAPQRKDPHDRLRIFQYQIMLNERAIQVRRGSSQESQVTLRKHQTSLAGNMTVTSKANKSREKRPRRPCSLSISFGDASNCFVVQVKSADSYRDPNFRRLEF